MFGTFLTLVRAQDAFKEFLLHEQFCRLGDTSATVILSKVNDTHEHIQVMAFCCGHVAIM